MNKRRLEQIEKYVIDYFQARQQTRILAKELFDSTSTFANADIVRALEDLEKMERLLVRHTTEGNDYISLTPQGIERLGLQQAEVEDDVAGAAASAKERHEGCVRIVRRMKAVAPILLLFLLYFPTAAQEPLGNGNSLAEVRDKRNALLVVFKSRVIDVDVAIANGPSSKTY